MLDATYANRSLAATHLSDPFATLFGVDDIRLAASCGYMFDQYAFLAECVRKAGTNQAVLNVLGLPSSRGPELFNPNHKKPRRLQLAEAVKLSEAFEVPITGPMVSADSLVPILEVSLRHGPTEWAGPDVRRLAEEIESGLKFWRNFQASQQAQDRPRWAPADRDALSRDKRA